jgi:cytosine/adenosine deaminase-related metal-dependent hydrolase
LAAATVLAQPGGLVARQLHDAPVPFARRVFINHSVLCRGTTMSRLLLRGARVITMAANRPDAESLDILIENDRIVAIGECLIDHSAEMIDYAGRIIMPGLVNTQLHSWQAGLRCIGAESSLEEQPANMHGDTARHCRPEDMRIAGLAGALSQINCGTTTLGGGCSNDPTPAHTDAAIEGLLASGIRSVVMHGTPFAAPDGPGHRNPLTGQLRHVGSAPSLRPDADSVVSGGVLVATRVALARLRGLDHQQQRLRNRGMASSKATITGKQALSWATVEGARALGLADRVGTLEPGMQADLIVIDATRLNLWPAHDPIAAALHADTSNIEAVMIGGTWRKRDHAIIGMDVLRVREGIFESGALA